MEPAQENADNPGPDEENLPLRELPKQAPKLIDSIREKQNALSKAYHAIVLPPVILNTISNLETSIKDGAFETLLQLLHDQIEIESFKNPEPADSLNIVQPSSTRHRNSIYRKNAVEKLKAVDDLRRCASSYSRIKEKDRKQLLTEIEQNFVKLLNIHFPQVELISVGIHPDECDQKVKKLIVDGVEALEKWCVQPDIAELDKLVQQLNSKTNAPNIAQPKTPLQNAKTHQSLNIMLKSIDRFQPFLKVILEKTEAFNERIQCDLDTPLHYAVRSKNASFIEWLLGQESLDVNCRNKQMKTALFILCEQYKAARKVRDPENRFAQLKECRTYILRLLQHGAAFNICSSKALLPYELLTQNGKSMTPSKDQMQLEEQDFLIQCENEVQQRNGHILKRQNQQFTNVECCHKTIELYEIFLRFKNLDTFNEVFSKHCININEISKVITLLLHTAVELNLPKCVDLILDRGGKMMFAVDQTTSLLKYRVELKGLLKKACDKANSVILAKLLSRMEKDKLLINEENILVDTLNTCAKMTNENDRKPILLETAKLMATDKRIIHTKTDKYGNSALQLALKYGFTDIAKALTMDHKYMFLGTQNTNGETPLDCASYEFCKEYFDQCVSQIDSGDVLIDLNGINPYVLKKHQNKHRATPKVRSHKGTHSRDFRSEMACLQTIANSKKLKQLLHHPAIYTFILIKWLRFSMWHWYNLLLTMAATVAFSYFSIEYICHENFSIPLYIASWCGLAFVVVRELLQWIMFGNKYFRLFQNWIDMANIFGMLIVLGLKDYSLISSLVVIIFAIQIIQLIGSLPFNSISTYRCMFRVVALNFIKSIALFCPLILAFAYSFYLYYNDKLVPVNTNGTDNPFDSATAAGVKIMVMASGEFEAASMNINGSVVIIFLLFIFCVPMVIQNLINGLAVSDISEIRKESEAISLSEKVLLLARFESGLNRNTSYKPIGYILKYLRRLSPGLFFKNYHHVIKISVKDDAKIMIDSRYSQLSCCGNQSLSCFKLSCISRPIEINKGEGTVSIELQPQTDPELGQPLLSNNGLNGAPAPKTAEGKKKKSSKNCFEYIPRIPAMRMISPMATLDEAVLEELLSIAKQTEIIKGQKSKKSILPRMVENDKAELQKGQMP